MYKIIGGDQKEYGPVTSDEVNAWILEGRANGQTQALAEGSSDWRPLASFPEFAAVLAAKYPPAAPPPLMESGDPGLIAASVFVRNIPLSIGSCLGRAWRLCVENAGLFLGATFLLLVIWLALAFIPFIGGIANLVLYGAMYGGFYLIFLRRLRGQPASVADLFSGFSPRFVQFMLAGILTQVLAGIGMLLCFVPGIYLTVAWKFSLALVADRNLEFWPAMELSRKVITRYWFQVFGLIVVAFLPVLLFALYGLIRTFEIVFSIMQTGQFDFNALPKLVSMVVTLSLGQQLVLLFTLPFATAALMHAYEDLFGARTAPAA
jgi:hypothetical protein